MKCHQPLHCVKWNILGKDGSVVLTKVMQSIVSLCVPLYVIKMETEEKTAKLWHEWLRQLVITWLHKQELLSIFSGPCNWQLSCWWQALANIEYLSLANKKSGQTRSRRLLMTKSKLASKNEEHSKFGLWASYSVVIMSVIMLNNDPWGSVQFTFIHRVH